MGKWRWCHSYKRLYRGGVGFGEMEVVSQLQGVLRMCRGGVGLWGNGGGVTTTGGVGVGLG